MIQFMPQDKFIEELAEFVQKYAPQYGIMVCSPIIAQGILESASGTSNKVAIVLPDGSIDWRHNYFGLKWRNNRCAISNKYFEEWTSEQRTDGSRYNKVDRFCRFDSLEECVIGYFQWTNIKNYTNLKGVTDPYQYLVNIKADKYATSVDYVDKVYNIVKKYNLTRFDNISNKESDNMSNLKIAIDAGHGLMTSGKRCMKRLDSNETREWTLNSRIASILQEELVNYNCEVLRVDDITGATDISLSKRVKSANDWGADVYISIHHDAGANGGIAGGTTVFYCSSKMERCVQAQNLYNCIVKYTKLVGDRATRVRNYGYYVIKKTKMPAFLIENGFMDSVNDIPVILSKKHAINTANGIIEFLTSSFRLTKKKASEVVAKPVTAPTGFKVKVIVNSLNIRKGPGTLYSKTGSVNGGVYTITKTDGNWGFLKSGAGWINISSKYCKRL